MAAKGFGAKSIELLGSGNATINSGSNDIVLNPNSKVSVTGNFHTIGQILGYSGTAGTNNQILVSNSSGQANWSSISDTNNPVPSSFLQLTDTPTRTNDLYTSNDAGKIVVVNDLNTALEFRSYNFLNLDDCPNSYTSPTSFAGKLVAVNSGATGLEFIDSISLTKLVVSGSLVEKFTRISGTTSASLDLRDGNVFQLVLGSSTTSVAFTNCPASSGEAYAFTLIVSNTATADVTITWPTSVKWAADNGEIDYVPTRTEAANKSDVWVFTTYDEGTTWLGVIASFGYDQLPTS